MNTTKGICYGVSVGPGADKLITIEAIDIIKSSDVIFLPSAPKEECRAYIAVKKSIPDIDKYDIRCVDFSMSKEKKTMQQRHLEIFEETRKVLDEGKSIAFLTLGEVNLYSTYIYIHRLLAANGYDSRFISGISSIQAISSRVNKELVIGDEELHIFPSMDALSERLSLPGTKVFMKPKGDTSECYRIIEDYVHKNEGAMAYGISECGYESEIIADSVDELCKLKGYFTVIIVRGDNREKAGYDYFENHACKYYPCHAGTEHINCLFCYCPMYRLHNCPGNPSYKEAANGKIKVCTDCTFPHSRENYPKIMELLREQH